MADQNQPMRIGIIIIEVVRMTGLLYWDEAYALMCPQTNKMQCSYSININGKYKPNKIRFLKLTIAINFDISGTTIESWGGGAM